MRKLRPVRHVPARMVKEFYEAPLERGSHVVERSRKLFEAGFPVRFIRNFHVEHRPAELHLHEDDVFFCMHGSVCFTLGGQLVNSRTEDNLTFFGDCINGGKEVVLYEGDWLHVPAGQAHQHTTPHLCHLMVIKISPPKGEKL